MSDEAIEQTNEETAAEEADEAAEEEPMPLVRPRECAGMINRAKEVRVWVEWGPDADAACYLQVKKENARVLVDEAKELDCDIAAGWEDGKEGGVLLIGPCEVEEGEEEEETGETDVSED